MGANESTVNFEKINSEEGAHILVIRLSAMGDVAMTIPVLEALTKQYPRLRITVLTRAFFTPMFSSLKSTSVYAAELKTTHRGLVGLWRLYKELKKDKPDAVADLHNVLRSKVLRFFFSFTSVPIAHIDKGRAEKKSLTAFKNKRFGPLKSTHKRYARVFNDLGYPISLGKTNWQVQRALSETVSELTNSHDLKWIGIAPFAAFEGKMYPLHLLKQVLKQLNDTKKYKIFLFGGGKEEEIQLIAIASQFSKVISISDKLKFEEELALISHLDLMLSMDSGNGHLAAIFGIPTVTLWGVTHPYAGFYPYGQDLDNALLADRKQFPGIPTSVYGNKFPKGYEKAIATIPPDKIVRKVEAVLLNTNK